MRIFNRILVIGFWLTLPLSGMSQDVGVLHLRPLHLEFPASWSFDGSKSPIVGRGPNGEFALISVMRKSAGTGNSQLSPQAAALDFKSSMEQLNSKPGSTVVREVGAFPVSEGKVGLSAASERSGIFNVKTYFVQYLLANDNALIYLTFEGKGGASEAIQRFDEFLNTQRWEE